MNIPYFEDSSYCDTMLAKQYLFYSFIDDNEYDVPERAHWHYYIEILHFFEGSGYVLLDGQILHVSEGDMVVINPRDVHDVYTDKGKHLKYTVVKFDPAILYSNSSDAFIAKFILPYVKKIPPDFKYYQKEELSGTGVPLLIEEAHQEYTQKTYGFELAVRTKLCAFYLWLLRDWHSKGINYSVDFDIVRLNLDSFIPAFYYIHEHYSESITAEQVARVCNLSYSYFSRQFKKLAGISFVRYLNYQRLIEAEKLLLSKDMDIAGIAYETGFTDASHFIRHFKEFRHITPKQFRERIIRQIK